MASLGGRIACRGRPQRAGHIRSTAHPAAGLQDWEDAARLYRAARTRGLTVKSSIDCLIAAVALRTDSSILALDRDFDTLAEITDLELVIP